MAIVAFMPNHDKTTSLISVAAIVWGIGIVLSAIAGGAWLLGDTDITEDYSRLPTAEGSAVHEAAPAGPNWAESVTAIATAVLALAAVIALLQLVIARAQMREARSAKNLQTRSDLTRKWDAYSFRELRARFHTLAAGGSEALRDKILELRDHRDPEYFELLKVPDFFEDIGIAVKNQEIEFGVVRQSLGATVPHYWSLWFPFVIQIRGQLGDPKLYEHFQYLAERVTRQVD